ncbi:acetylxylan esterase [Nakamurella lactea]|uniref:acetylxylan esterase n=1 Tax=Nakamurella lactea TaxID=459515 RepID=UPI000419F236|nr:acetylxylan esterase [Nakamurella lactea]
MSYFDMPLDELERYRPDVRPPVDFDRVWAETLAAARSVPMQVQRSAATTRLRTVTVEDLRFPGFGGEPIAAWLVRPAAAAGVRLPIVVSYLGYGGGRGLPFEHLRWASAGYAELLMDTRGQGSTWGTGGDTPDPHGSAPAYPGSLTRGIGAFETHYYRRFFTDAVRAVDAARSLGDVDPDQVVVAGSSQGGGTALAVGGLVDGLAAVIAGVPFLCHLRRAVAVSDSGPYAEIEKYLAVHRGQAEQVFHTLDYIDAMHHASRASAPALFTAGLRDHTCPPSTVYAAFHAYGGPASMVTYEFNGHESGGAYQDAAEIDFLQDVARVLPPTG